MRYADFFEQMTGHAPYPYQVALADGPWPELLDIPTGLGKTAAVIVAWLWRRLSGDEHTGRRLVYCLPMRTLVEQTDACARAFCERAGPWFEERGLDAPCAHMLMGGSLDTRWDTQPERPAILVGTQDMLLSRALDRGYGMSRFRWPVHFGLLNSDCLWVFDETQLMGVGVETSAQLQGLRDALGTSARTRTLWMSATLGREQLNTVDHPEPPGSWPRCELEPADLAHERVVRRTGARKAVEPLAAAGCTLDKETHKKGYAAAVAERVARAHEERGGLTLVIVNRVQRAQDIVRELHKRGLAQVALIHSRFRRADRDRNMQLLLAGAGDAGRAARVVVATQAIEAGVDVSAYTMFTELAPWPSLVQRLGRCNRHGEYDDARVYWMDIEGGDKDEWVPPYQPGELAVARGLLGKLAAAGGDAGPVAVRAIDYQAPPVLRPVLRRRDVLDLFDTTPDLCGNDVDVSIYVRDAEDLDCQLFWREPGERKPGKDTLEPRPEELCRVSIKATAEFLDRLKKKRAQATDAQKQRLRAYTWDTLANTWVEAERPRPGELILVHAHAGGYDPDLGWTGEVAGQPVPEAELEAPAADGPDSKPRPMEAMGGDPATDIGEWVTLRAHLGHVRDEAAVLARALGLDDELVGLLAEAGLWHDVGKAHEAFQDKLLAPVKKDPDRYPAPPGEGPWAKSNHDARTSSERPHFRHELASALAYLAVRDHGDDTSALVAYLIAAHHGKVRLSIRSLPDEKRPDTPGRLYARGVWQGDSIPALMGPDGMLFDEDIALDLSCMQLGEGSWLERMLALRDNPSLGPFRLAMLELVVRIADWRASEKEQRKGYDE